MIEAGPGEISNSTDYQASETLLRSVTMLTGFRDLLNQKLNV